MNIETIIAVLIVLIAAGCVGYGVYRSVTGKSECGGCSCGCDSTASVDSEDSSSICADGEVGK